MERKKDLEFCFLWVGIGMRENSEMVNTVGREYTTGLMVADSKEISKITEETGREFHIGSMAIGKKESSKMENNMEKQSFTRPMGR